MSVQEFNVRPTHLKSEFVALWTKPSTKFEKNVKPFILKPLLYFDLVLMTLFSGGMQDYNYFKKGCMEITLEISCCKYPLPQELKKLWEQNKQVISSFQNQRKSIYNSVFYFQSLLSYSLEALKGVSGQILDSSDERPIENANIEIIGRNMTFKSSQNGYFWRLLLPGSYQLKVGFMSVYIDLAIAAIS